MNSQKVQRVTKLHARDLLSLSLQLLQPKREAAEGTTKNSEKPANNQTEDTRMGTIIWGLYKYYALRNLCGIFMRAISAFLLTVLLAPLPLKAEEQVYLILFTHQTGQSTIPMRDAAHCEEEGEKWLVTPDRGRKSGRIKGFHCVTGYRINAGS